ncbi:MAG: Coenzyme F420 hydrogenase/dehydrogenase, beta subunit C-terminal domain [Methanocalculus sp.]|uniref:Coenzyme F420 hydrogenase/dehydrogenase, beta subunit C-terminal domain n=1 Tax=Methanocalculus sp. TaxID=2004547 RepID=UPI00272494BD|nr:Coenzyme F420 hydrogenase/dehydrogenase, beta subunit C-terminal domain [Methanocalculus sp.]MDO9539489.1 Coenzyme F420 hydrogenase/dehydrogenase, beta subunit C-terminal domain [Methanocalculus sp.]
MVAKGDMLYAWASTEEGVKKGECGGAVTALLKYALESKMVDGVLVVKKGADIYDATVEVVTNPAEVEKASGSLHCGTLLLSKILTKYLAGANGMKLALPVKGCDTMGILELARRNQINLDNLVLIGLNCGGSVSPIDATKMIKDKFDTNPDDVVKEEIDKGQFIIMTKDGHHKGISIDELEEDGYGRRSNCRRCLYKVPRQADLACGNWGVIGDKAGKATFVEVCSDKGATLVSKASAAGAVVTSAADPKGIAIRGKVEGAMLKLGNKWRKHDFSALSDNLWDTVKAETSRCIKCYSCIENCPVCLPIEKELKAATTMVPTGQIPPSPMFHMRRFAHISDSCINCGQCEELCPMDIPLALLSHAVRAETDATYNPKLGSAPYKN